MVKEPCRGKGKKGCDEVAEVAEADEDDESETLLVRAENEAGMEAPCKGKGCPKSGTEEVLAVVLNGESGEIEEPSKASKASKTSDETEVSICF